MPKKSKVVKSEDLQEKVKSLQKVVKVLQGPRPMSEAQQRLFGGAGRDRIERAAPERRTQDGQVFGSILESDVYSWIKVLLDRSMFVLQPVFELQPKFQLRLAGVAKPVTIQPIDYKSDFLVGAGCYLRSTVDAPVPAGCLVIDAKGWKTPEFKIKAKLFKFRYGVDLFCVKNKTQLLKLLIDYGIITKEIGETHFKGACRKALAADQGLPEGGQHNPRRPRSFAPASGPGIPAELIGRAGGAPRRSRKSKA